MSTISIIVLVDGFAVDVSVMSTGSGGHSGKALFHVHMVRHVDYFAQATPRGSSQMRNHTECKVELLIQCNTGRRVLATCCPIHDASNASFFGRGTIATRGPAPSREPSLDPAVDSLRRGPLAIDRVSLRTWHAGRKRLRMRPLLRRW